MLFTPPFEYDSKNLKGVVKDSKNRTGVVEDLDFRRPPIFLLLNSTFFKTPFFSKQPQQVHSQEFFEVGREQMYHFEPGAS